LAPKKEQIVETSSHSHSATHPSSPAKTTEVLRVNHLDADLHSSFSSAARKLEQAAVGTHFSGLESILYSQNIQPVDSAARIVRRVTSSVGSVQVLPNAAVRYPTTVIEALKDIYAEYNRSFEAIVQANREHESDYSFLRGPDNKPYNIGVQIDMRGLPVDFLAAAEYAPVAEVRGVLKQAIFEIENSLAAYALLAAVSTSEHNESALLLNLKQHINALRRFHDKPVALLACTDEKYEGMLAFEFGRTKADGITDEDVRSISGFDRLFSPQQFRDYLTGNIGCCEYLLFARTSEPLTRLRNPKVAAPETILSDSDIRRVVRQHALTINIDNPAMPLNSLARVNDTKAYLPAMGMGFLVQSVTDLASESLKQFLSDQGADTQSTLRGKPLQASYGCYGHLRGTLDDKKFQDGIKKNLELRGPYVVQTEKPPATLVDTSTDETFHYIDRVFLGMLDGEANFLGGVRTITPAEGKEAREGRIHGSATSLYAPIG
jgi:hypothetical protein